MGADSVVAPWNGAGSRVSELRFLRLAWWLQWEYFAELIDPASGVTTS